MRLVTQSCFFSQKTPVWDGIKVGFLFVMGLSNVWELPALPGFGMCQEGAGLNWGGKNCCTSHVGTPENGVGCPTALSPEQGMDGTTRG